jgi:hypothetical protein
MAVFNSYSDLKTQIANYLARSDLTDKIPTFIELAEIRLNRDLRLRQTLQNSTYTMTAGNKLVPVPADFLEMKEQHINTNPITNLTFQSTSVFYRNGLVNTSGKPVYYTQVARDFAYAPTPDSAYVVEMTYYKKPTIMSDTNPSNEYLTYCPDLLLYGALAESAPYLMDDARLTTWQTMYNVGLASLTKSSEESEYPAQPLAVQLS